MTTIEDLRKSVTQSSALQAVVGATDIFVTKACHLGEMASTQLREQISRARRDLDAKQLQALAQQMPSRAVGSSLHLVARAEETYEDLAERGARVMQRMQDRRQSGAAEAVGAPEVVQVTAPPAVKKAAPAKKAPATKRATAARATTAKASPAKAPKAEAAVEIAAEIDSPKPPA